MRPYTAEEDTSNAGRLAQARIRALQDELAAQGRELREAHSRLKERDAELKSLLTEKLAVWPVDHVVHIMCLYSPRRPPHSVPVLSTSSTT